MSERVDLQEFIGGFVVEAEELVAASNAALLEIEAGNAEGTTRPKSVRELFRALHTIKGLAGMVGVEPIVEISHALETIVRNADRGGGRLRRGAVELSIEAVKAIGERVRAVADGRPPAQVPARLLDALSAVESAGEVTAEPPPMAAEWDSRLQPSERQHLFVALRDGQQVWSLAFVPTAETSARGVTIATVRIALAELGDIIKVAPRTLVGTKGVAFDFLLASAHTVDEIAAAAATTAAEITRVKAPELVATPVEAAPAETEEVAPLGRAVVRVELGRLDELQEQLSLLIVSRFRLEREITAMAAAGHDVRRLREVAELQGRQLRDLRRATLRVRMVRVAEVLEPLTMLIRSLARPGQAGAKEVRLEIDARDTEIDKAVADRLLPALVHLVRNAIDHAIEPVDERLAKGKPRVATLRVTCLETSSGQLELVIRDDGRGIDRAQIARRANRPIESDDDLLDVITTPGFSTREVATRTSGRGLGMDIVRRIAVTELGGSLELTTELGKGTAFRLLVPLTIAIIDVFSFQCGPQAFVVPVNAVDEILEITAGTVVLPPDPRTAGVAVTMVERHGRPISLISLGALLAIDGGAGARKAIVLRRSGDPIALAVDRMLGRQEVVVRPVDDPLVSVPGIAGATDLGDGRPTLVLDLGELVAGMSRERNV